jgi:hypothetical protein
VNLLTSSIAGIGYGLTGKGLKLVFGTEILKNTQIIPAGLSLENMNLLHHMVRMFQELLVVLGF